MSNYCQLLRPKIIALKAMLSDCKEKTNNVTRKDFQTIEEFDSFLAAFSLPIKEVMRKIRKLLRERKEELFEDIEERDDDGEELTRQDLRFLYQLDRIIMDINSEDVQRIEKILGGRDHKADVSFATGYSQKQISITKEEALKGGIKYHYGDLWLNDLTTAEGLKLPEIIGGDLDFRNLITSEGLNLPKIIGGRLDLGGLTTAVGLKLSEAIGGNLYLQGLTTSEGLNLPKIVGRIVYLGSLPETEKEKLRQKYPNLRIL